MGMCVLIYSSAEARNKIWASGGIGRLARFRFQCSLRTCGFKSRLAHQRKASKSKDFGAFSCFCAFFPHLCFSVMAARSPKTIKFESIYSAALPVIMPKYLLFFGRQMLKYVNQYSIIQYPYLYLKHTKEGAVYVILRYKLSTEGYTDKQTDDCMDILRQFQPQSY